MYVYVYKYLICIICIYILLLVFSVICMHQGSESTQFQLSVCMYSTYGRIDNKADFDFDYTVHTACACNHRAQFIERCVFAII